MRNSFLIFFIKQLFLIILFLKNQKLNISLQIKEIIFFGYKTNFKNKFFIIIVLYT